VHRRVLILGAGFGGLELATMLSEGLGEDAEVVRRPERRLRLRLLEARLMFGRVRPEEIPGLLAPPYADFVKAGSSALRET